MQEIVKQLTDINKRLTYQENIHRNGGKNGIIYHKWGVLQLLVISTFVNIILGIVII